MSDLALYRKYRSSSFDAVIGQPQIVDTLKSAIASDRLSHAYLFTGPRGVGKTSVARLLARAANCTHEDPGVKPCGECFNCKIEIGSHLDLIEIDAASNRGIDDARALREKITSAPSMGKRKVYIIDEVHMLTTEAFNALLKTLEEPPSHAMFILATTEAHKLPDTIISRTQRFSFRPIDANAITAHLKNIAASENIKITEEALALIAASSAGGFRDAISLLDQVGSSQSAGVLAVESVRDLLGQGDPAILNGIIKAVGDMNATEVFRCLDQAWTAGIQPTQLSKQLIERWRQNLRQSVSAGSEGIGLAVAAIDALMPVQRSPWPELALETALVQLASQHTLTPPTFTTAPHPAQATQPRPSTTSAPATSTATRKNEAVNEDTPDALDAPAGPLPSGQPSGDLWIKTLTQIKQKNNSLYALLRASCTVTFQDSDVLLGCRFSFHRDRLKETKNIQVIEQALARVYGHKYRVLPQLETQAVVEAPQVANPESELMSSALEILGGEVVYE